MLTIYTPLDNPKSKAWEVFTGIMKSWPDNYQILDNSRATDPLDNAMFWGFVNNNLALVHKLEERKQNYWFTDTPYFGRFDNANLKADNHYWRICKNNIHARKIENCSDDRFKKFNIEIKKTNNKGKNILVCPSSAGIHMYLRHTSWLNDTINEIKKYTDRPIKIREKPRDRGTSGPSVAKVPIQEDLKDAWCCVTSCSISAVESMCEGVPIICHEKSFAASVTNNKIHNIENPVFDEPNHWLYSLAYQQFTPEEILNGTAVKILKNKGIV